MIGPRDRLERSDKAVSEISSAGCACLVWNLDDWICTAVY